MGDLSMYTINSDGTLTLLAPGTIAAGVCPSAVAVDPSGKFAYAADTGDCDFLVGSISIYKINPAFAGTLSATATIDAETFPGQNFWTTDYVGAGPFKIDRWERGAFIDASAFDGHALGRPKITRVHITWNADFNATLATLLSGEGNW